MEGQQTEYAQFREEVQSRIDHLDSLTQSGGMQYASPRVQSPIATPLRKPDSVSYLMQYFSTITLHH